MNSKNKTFWASAAGLGAMLIVGSPVAAQSQGVNAPSTRGDRRIEGQRFTTMRALAHRLDEAAQTAARGASDTPEERNGRMQQRFLWAINDFARQARSFHERMDQYGAQPWDVGNEVTELNQRAQRVSAQLRGARAFRDTYQDWAQVTTSLDLMNRSLRGQRVTIPAVAGRGYQPFDETYGYRDGRHHEGFGTVVSDPDGYLAGTTLTEFRRLARSLDVETTRLMDVAERNLGPGSADNRSMTNLRRFAQRTSDLSRSSRGDMLSSRETGATVGQLIDDARENDRAMQETRSIPRVEWAPSIRILEQMSAAVPRS